MRALLVMAGTVVVLIAVLSGPAQAAPAAIIERDGEPVVVTVNGRAVVGVGEVADDVWVGNGSATINGRVEGSVIVLNGSANVAGSVGGDVTVVRGDVSIGSQAVIEGDVRATSAITRADGSVVDGSVDQGSVLDGLLALAPVVRTYLWIGLTIALFALGIAAMRLSGHSVRNARNRLTARPLGSAVRGLALLTLLPLVAIVALATIVGGLLSMLLLALAALAGLAGLVVVAAQIGRWMLPKQSSALLAFLLGAVVLRIVALVPVVGGLVTVLAAMFGAGALLLSRSDTGEDEPAEDETVDDAAARDDAAAAVAPEAEWTDPLLSPDVGDVSATGPNLDLRSGSPVLDTRADALTIDLLDGGAPPTEPPTDAPRSEVLASLPVREDHFADDPHEAPGNGIRQALFAEPPSGATSDSGVTLSAEPVVQVDSGGYHGPLFTWPDATGTPPASDPDQDDGYDSDQSVGGLFGDGGRAWRPSRN